MVQEARSLASIIKGTGGVVQEARSLAGIIKSKGGVVQKAVGIKPIAGLLDAGHANLKRNYPRPHPWSRTPFRPPPPPPLPSPPHVLGPGLYTILPRCLCV